ncbi:MAG: glutamine--fructose-6-phosphate transaminase (isomerizing) [Gemmataceae bacterium]|nr:glutamine--fructose-6-phosphate transaminase (isomerizing) [Gemmataceae bacterium]
MCGIVGYTGFREAEPILITALNRLEYRGYDSAGMATLSGRTLHLRKKAGKIANLARLLKEKPAAGTTGISHTRWATHGAATDRNAHPHLGGNCALALVHNGVIENYSILRSNLEMAGFQFSSDTDTEVLAQLIAFHWEKKGRGLDLRDFVLAISQSLSQVKGTFGIAAVSPHFPGAVFGARLGSPLVLGFGEKEFFLASDAMALAGLAKKAIFLEDHQICVLTPDSWSLQDMDQSAIDPAIETLDFQNAEYDRGRFDHYMLKEIYEQPEALENALRGRLNDKDSTARFGGLNLPLQQLRKTERIILTGCGTSYHAGLVGEYLFEELARMPVEVEYASEFRYRNPPIEQNTLVIALTQSGETADTLAALRETKLKGVPVLSLCNVVGSSIAREADGGVYLHAGPEIGVASTKAFSNQVAVLSLLALFFGRMRHLSPHQGAQILEGLKSLPDAMRKTLECEEQARDIASNYHQARNFLYMGRQYLYPVALEAALKLKEISYIHAEGYPAAEMKHGPIALVDSETPSVFLISPGPMYDKVMSNLEEVKARGGPVIAVASHVDPALRAKADEIIEVPRLPEWLQPVVSNIPLQLLAYHIALMRGCDVDKPRNLAKSVTVE